MKQRYLSVIVVLFANCVFACAAAPAELSAESAAPATSCQPSPISTETPVPDVVTHPGLTEAEKCALATANVEVGDLLFTEIASNPVGAFVFGHVAELTSSWTSHVGIVIADASGRPIVAEATTSLFDRRSRKTPLCEFLSHSKDGHFALRRLPGGFDAAKIPALERAIDARMGVRYDTGFDLDDPSTTYCSRFVREIYLEATGIELGRVQTLREVVDEKQAIDPSYDDTLIRLWFMSLEVPWCRRMVSPATQLVDPSLRTVVSTD